MISKTFGRNQASPIVGTEKEHEIQQSRGLAPQADSNLSPPKCKSRVLRLNHSAWYVGSNKTSSTHFPIVVNIAKIRTPRFGG
jgi:hypothetical protein